MEGEYGHRVEREARRQAVLGAPLPGMRVCCRRTDRAGACHDRQRAGPRRRGIRFGQLGGLRDVYDAGKHGNKLRFHLGLAEGTAAVPVLRCPSFLPFLADHGGNASAAGLPSNGLPASFIPMRSAPAIECRIYRALCGSFLNAGQSRNGNIAFRAVVRIPWASGSGLLPLLLLMLNLSAEAAAG